MGPAGWRRPVKNMEVMLYPLKFKPILKSQIWGGDRLVKAGKRLPAKLSAAAGSIGESWEISGVEGDVSVVSNGFLKSNNLEEITEVYMGDLVGEKVYDTYGLEFPVLVKFIDAHDVLSVQVHPDDGLTRERHGSRGKTEMWYVADCEPGAYLYVGFNRPVTRDEYLRAVSEGTLTDLLMRYEVRKGDAYYIPAGTVHAIGPGLLIAEIQETSDITYRISDWGRLGRDGKPRQLHTAEATDAIDFNYGKEYFRPAVAAPGSVKEIVSTPFFTTNVIEVDGEVRRDYASLDSFVAYICTDGALRADTDGGSEKLAALESLLLPAEIDEAVLSGKGTLLEVYMV